MSEKIAQTAELIQRIHALEVANKEIDDLKGQIQSLQQDVVNTVASQIQSLFTNPVMLDSVTHAIMVAAANALAHKARSSQDRAPELTVIEAYIPGALRAILGEDGTIEVSQQLKGAENASSSWESSNAAFEEKGVLGSFIELMAAYGAEAGRVYYITDTVSLQKHRESVAQHLAAANVMPADEFESESEEQIVAETVVKLTTKPFNQLEWDGEESIQLDPVKIELETECTVYTPDGIIVKQALDLKAGDIVEITRAGSVVKEVVVAVEVGAFGLAE